jgi:hypothetical protein
LTLTPVVRDVDVLSVLCDPEEVEIDCVLNNLFCIRTRQPMFLAYELNNIATIGDSVRELLTKVVI